MTLPATLDMSISRLASASRLSRMCLFMRDLESMLILFSGIYVPDDDRWPESFRGIGIRIEDSICVGDDSPIVLSAEAAKEVCTVSNDHRWSSILTGFLRLTTLRRCVHRSMIRTVNQQKDTPLIYYSTLSCRPFCRYY